MPLTGTFDTSFVALLAEMWAELEALLAAADAEGAGPAACAAAAVHPRAELRAQALLLELELLADRCDSARWQSLCGADQVERVRAVVQQMLALLDFSPPEQGSPQARGANHAG